jgi:tetratricopeptide (TPR) repeat protein
MVRTTWFRRLTIATFALMFAGWVAAPAFAQLTTVVKGKVVDEAGQPVEGAEIKFEFLGDITREMTTKTDKNGNFLRAGVAPGPWKITATKDKLVAVNPRVAIALDPLTLPVMTIGEPKKAAAAGMTAKEVEAANKKQEQMKADFDAAKLAFDSGDYDGAITGLQKVIEALPTCAACYLSIGDAYSKKNDLPNAETAYLKSIELDATKPAPYAALATIYNTQKKFDEAGKMSAKANELSEAAGGGGDAGSVFNQGVILWNQSKAADAAVQFEKATKLDPTMADAFYWLGMCKVNLGKLPEAKAPFQEYMKLAPTGQYAGQVKAMLDVIK